MIMSAGKSNFLLTLDRLLFRNRRSSAVPAGTEVFLYMMGVAVPQDVTRVRIHASVEHIPENAFNNRTELVEVELHDGLRSIGVHAFHSCTSLQQIKIPSSVTDIFNGAFENCRSLKEVDLAEGLQRIGAQAFQNCYSLHRIKVPSSVTDIGNYAFLNCKSLKEVELHDGLRSIGWSAFQNCTSLLRIRIPPSVTDIRFEAFKSCASLKEVDLTEGLQMIGGSAFFKCTLLHINIPSTVTTIGIWAFSRCTSLREVGLKEGLQTIQKNAFQNCTSLQQINVPLSVTTIGDYAFDRCTSLTEVNLTNGLQTIGVRAFNNCTSLYRIKIPSSVTIIYGGAFHNCTSLKAVGLEEGLQTIGGITFQNCTSLLRINIPSTVTVLGGGAFVYSINPNAFCHCTLLRNVAIAPSSALPQDVFMQSFPSLQNMGFSIEMIKGRFDELPLHRHCYYYRSHHHIEQTMDSTTRKCFNEEVSRLPAHGLQQDCFGMTPLHVLLCSSAGYDVRVCQCMIEKYPGAMLIKDKWGEVPLAYALFGEAPMEVIHLLLETHMQTWKAMPFDFGDVILRLATKRGTSADYVRDVIRAQRTHHHALEIDWQRIADDFIRAGRDIPIKMFSVFVEASVSKRSICMNDEHRIEVDARLREIEIEIEDEDDDVEELNVQYYGEIRDMVTSYVQLHYGQLKEAITILELALWKTMICSKVDDQESRSERRTSGGRCLEVVITHVLAFL